jgi:peptidase propeptide and YPEB domain protein
MNIKGERKMKKKILKFTVLGIAVLGVLTVAYGASRKNRNKISNGTAYINNNASNSQNITLEKAKSIALAKVPGANNSHVRELHLNRENGRLVYEGEIFYNGQEYEFDINAATGEIVKWKAETKSTPSYNNRSVNATQQVTPERAKSIALAQVSGANQSHVGKVDLDLDNGTPVYEIEIFYNNSKYEFDIDATTGEIIGTEVKNYKNN